LERLCTIGKIKTKKLKSYVQLEKQKLKKLERLCTIGKIKTKKIEKAMYRLKNKN